MADNTITSANSTFVLSAAPLFPAAVKIEGYAADASFAFDSAEVAQVLLGVDGKMSAGWVPRIFTQTVTLQADSESRAVFDAIVGYEDTQREKVFLHGVITLPSISRSFSLTRGVLTNYKALPDGARVLQPTPFTITWESVTPAVL